MRLAALLLLLAASCASTTTTTHPAPPATPASAEHDWLMQLVGDWEAVSEMEAEAGAEPTRWVGTEDIDAIGALWVVAEGEVDFGEEHFESRMTLGYDPEQRCFVGTWIDSVQSHLWNYRGQLDADQRALTLEAQGPSIVEPGRTTLYRDRIELVTPDHKRLVSAMREDDGTWTTYMEVDYYRR